MAPETACTDFIWSSKAMNVFVANAIGAAKGVTAANSSAPIVVTREAKARRRRLAPFSPRTSRSSSANSSTNARPARMA